jgi:hypothetical protein
MEMKVESVFLDKEFHQGRQFGRRGLGEAGAPACNMLAAGHAVSVRGKPAQSGRSVKQEPTEATKQEPAPI